MSYGNAILLLRHAAGSIDKNEIPKEVRAGYFYVAARIVHVVRDAFLDKISGYRKLISIPGLIQEYYVRLGKKSAAPLATIVTMCDTAKELIGACEVGLKPKAVFDDPVQYSAWSETPASTYEKVASKIAHFSDFTLSACDTYKLATKLGLVANRQSHIDKISNLAGIVFLAYLATNELAKWLTGRMRDIHPTTKKIDEKLHEFTTAQKVKSVFHCVMIFSYAMLTAIGVANMRRCALVANEALWKLGLSVLGLTCSVMAHLWEKIYIEELIVSPPPAAVVAPSPGNFVNVPRGAPVVGASPQQPQPVSFGVLPDDRGDGDQGGSSYHS